MSFAYGFVLVNRDSLCANLLHSSGGGGGVGGSWSSGGGGGGRGGGAPASLVEWR